MSLLTNILHTARLNIHDSVAIIVRTLVLGGEVGEWLEDRQERLEMFLDGLKPGGDPTDEVHPEDALEALRTRVSTATIDPEEDELDELEDDEDLASSFGRPLRSPGMPKAVRRVHVAPLRTHSPMRPQPEPKVSTAADDRIFPIAMNSEDGQPIIALDAANTFDNPKKLRLRFEDLERVSRDLEICGLALHLHNYTERYKNVPGISEPIEVSERADGIQIPLYGRNLCLGESPSLLPDPGPWMFMNDYIVNNRDATRGLRQNLAVRREDFRKMTLSLDLALGEMHEHAPKKIYISATVLVRDVVDSKTVPYWAIAQTPPVVGSNPANA